MVGSYTEGDEPIPGFRLVKLLGWGRFGEVWRASAPGGLHVALKIVSMVQKQGYKELRALNRLREVRHPNLVPMVALWLKDRQGRFLDEYSLAEHTHSSTATAASAAELLFAMGVGERTVADRLQECQKANQPGIPAAELLDYMDQVAGALDYLSKPIHNLGDGPVPIQHCDIKPQNILIVGNAAQICDLGIARTLEEPNVSATSGTAAYIAPELLSAGKPSLQTDQYSLAITYAELRTGSLPLDARTIAMAYMTHMQGSLNWSRLPRAEEAVLRRATLLDPTERYPSCRQLVSALREAVASYQSVFLPEFEPTPAKPTVTTIHRPISEPSLLITPASAPIPEPAMPDSLLPSVPNMQKLADNSTHLTPTAPPPTLPSSPVSPSYAEACAEVAREWTGLGSTHEMTPVRPSALPSPSEQAHIRTEVPMSAPLPPSLEDWGTLATQAPAPVQAVTFSESLASPSVPEIATDSQPNFFTPADPTPRNWQSMLLKGVGLLALMALPIALIYATQRFFRSPEEIARGQSRDEQSASPVAQIPADTELTEEGVQPKPAVGKPALEPGEEPGPDEAGEQAVTLARKGIEHLGKTEYKLAIERLSQAIAIDKQLLDAYSYRATARAALGEFDTAKTDCEYVLGINPSDTQARKVLADIIIKQGGNLEEASKHLEQALQANPKDAEMLFAAAHLYASQRKFDQAQKQLKAALDLEPSNTYFHYERTQIFQEMGRLEQVIRECTEKVGKDPNDAIAWMERAHARFRQESVRPNPRYEQVFSDLDEALKLKPTYPEAHALRGEIALQQEDYLEVIGHCTEALKHNPKLVNAYYCRGVAYQAQFGKEDRAIQDMNQVIAMQPTYAPAYLVRGKAYQVKRDNAKADADFRKAESLGLKANE